MRAGCTTVWLGPGVLAALVALAAACEWAATAAVLALLTSPAVTPGGGTFPATILLVPLTAVLVLLAAAVDKRCCSCCHALASARGRVLPPWAAQPACCIDASRLDALAAHRRGDHGQTLTVSAAGRIVPPGKADGAAAAACCRCSWQAKAADEAEARAGGGKAGRGRRSKRRAVGVTQACGVHCGLPATPVWLACTSGALEAVGIGALLAASAALPLAALPVLGAGALAVARACAAVARPRPALLIGEASPPAGMCSRDTGSSGGGCAAVRPVGILLAVCGTAGVLVHAALVSRASIPSVAAGVAAVILLATAAAIREASMGRGLAAAGTCGEGIPQLGGDDGEAGAGAGATDTVAARRGGGTPAPAHKTPGPAQPPEPLATWQAHGAVAVGRLCLGVCGMPMVAAAASSTSHPGAAVVAVGEAVGRGAACLAGQPGPPQCEWAGWVALLLLVVGVGGGAVLAAQTADAVALSRAQERRARRRLQHRRALAALEAKARRPVPGAARPRPTAAGRAALAARMRRGVDAAGAASPGRMRAGAGIGVGAAPGRRGGRRAPRREAGAPAEPPAATPERTPTHACAFLCCCCGCSRAADGSLDSPEALTSVLSQAWASVPAVAAPAGLLASVLLAALVSNALLAVPIVPEGGILDLGCALPVPTAAGAALAAVGLGLALAPCGPPTDPPDGSGTEWITPAPGTAPELAKVAGEL